MIGAACSKLLSIAIIRDAPFSVSEETLGKKSFEQHDEREEEKDTSDEKEQIIPDEMKIGNVVEREE